MRNRSLDIDNPGIRGHANRWFTNAGSARRAALQAANALGPASTIVHDPRPTRGLPHYHVVDRHGRRVSTHYFYGARPPRRVLRGRPDREFESESDELSVYHSRLASHSIIDGHCHAGKGDRLTAPWNTIAPLEKYLRRAQAAGIGRTVILPAGHSNYAEANRQIARIVDRQPDRFIGFASLHAQRDASRARSLIRTAVTELGLQGLKVHAYDATPNRQVCDAVREFRIPMLVDVVGRAYLVELFASQYPDINFIIPHMGSFMDDWRAQQQVVDQLVRFPNVYADTAGVRRFDFIAQAVRRAGAHKIIFGSDGPWLHPAVELFKIRMLRLSPDDEALILGGNLQRLLSDPNSVTR